MSAKRLICIFNSSSKAAYKIVDLPSVFSVPPVLVWLYYAEFVESCFIMTFLLKFIFLKFFLQFFLLF